MKIRNQVLIAVFAMLVIFPVQALAEPITINWWFAHGGSLGEKVQSIVSDFNLLARQIQGGGHLQRAVILTP